MQQKMARHTPFGKKRSST